MKDESVYNVSKDLIAPCGMNCGICSGFLAMQHDVKSKGIHVPYCSGCRIRNKQCAWLKKRCLLLQQKKVEYCFECPDYPCDKLQHLDIRYKTHFRMSMIENLNFIKKHGINQFQKQQQRQWKCPSCNNMICCHNGLCFYCDVEHLKKKKKKYRWDEK